MTDAGPHPLKRSRPADHVVRLIDRSCFARGGCVGAYSQVEFILADFVMNAARLEPYQDIGHPFPMNFSSRTAKVLQIAERDGPLAAEGDVLREVVRRIEDWEQYRHFLTHGWMDVNHNVGTGDVYFRFRRWVGAKKGLGAIAILDLTIEQMEEARLALIDLAEFTLTNFHDIYDRHQLESWRGR